MSPSRTPAGNTREHAILNLRWVLGGTGSEKRGRDDWIRTSDLLVPNEALYQAEPHPDVASTASTGVSSGYAHQ